MQNFTKEQLAAIKAAEDAAEQEEQFKRLDGRFNNNQPFIIRNQVKRTAALVASYFGNIYSGLGLSYVIFVIAEALPLWSRVLLAVLGLVGFEAARRFSADQFYDDFHRNLRRINWKMAALNFGLLFTLSCAGTVFGLYFLAKDTDPGAANLRAKIERLDERIVGHETNKNKAGEIYWPSLQAARKLEAEKQALMAELGEVAKVGNDEKLQAQPASYWQQKDRVRSISLASLALIMEIIFQMCMSFMSKFDYKQFLTLQKQREAAGSPTPSSGGTDLQQLAARVEEIAESLAAGSIPGANLANMSKTGAQGGKKSTARLIGFNRNPDGSTKTLSGRLLPVATAQNAASGADPSLQVKRLKQALANAKSQWAAWAAKLRKGEGRDETNEGNMKRLEAEMAEIALQIRALGGTV
jgi:hypothetical protein